MRFEDLGRRLREAGEAELLALTEEHLAELAVPEVRQVLCNPFVTARIIELILAQPRLLSSYEVRREIAAHPRTPETAAMRLIPGLPWRELLRIGSEIRIHPRVRRAADLRLVERLSALAGGERIAIARSAGPGVLARLRLDPEPRVVGALLENPRLTEPLVLTLAADERAPSRTLALIAESPRWGTRRGVRSALCRNPRTPQATALGILPLLGKRQLGAVAADPRLASPVRRRARLLLGQGPER